MSFQEVQFDGLVGPTHHYGGLSRGNIASQRHQGWTSNPRRACLEGLAKMKHVADLGIEQAVLPPHPRPDVAVLRQLGFTGSDSEVLERAGREDPTLLAACASSSAMWAANAATVSPSPDTGDGRMHISTANLLSQFHRSLEPGTSARILRAILPDASQFVHHAPLPACPRFADEGAANHMRLAPSHGQPGIELFVFGRADGDAPELLPKRFPARQTLDTARALTRRHALDESRVLTLRQNPKAIDAGAFHNDVVAVSNENVLLFHEHAFADRQAAMTELRRVYRQVSGEEPLLLEVAQREVPLDVAIDTYLFNSQLLTLHDGTMHLICPLECREHAITHDWLERLTADATSPISSYETVDVRQSMRNGGGPACLRLRVLMSNAQRQAAHQPAFLNQMLYERLRDWVHRHYRDELRDADLADPQLLHESRAALDELSDILKLGSIYDFQQ